jgi:endonuclease YncB( thermonuclease family)
VHLEIRLRLLDIDSWELKSEHRDKALECAARINSMLRGVPLIVHVTGGGRDRYGRWRALVYTPTGPLTDQLITAGIAWRRTTKEAQPTMPHENTPPTPPCGDQ